MRTTFRAAAALLSLSAAAAAADELTLMVETDLAALGYETGAVDGEETMETVIAISKFQAQNDIAVTGEVTPQLAGILSARVADANQPDAQREDTAGAGATVPAAATAEDDAAALQAAREACLEEKIREKREKDEKKRSLSRLFGAAGRIAARHGDYDIQQTTSEVYQAGATAEDLSIAAEELGISKNAIRACENPER